MCSPWQSNLKLNYMKNPSFGELCSLFQINQVCKEENQRRNLNIQQFRKLAKLPRGVQAVGESKHVENEFRNLVKLVKMNFATLQNFPNLAKSSCVIFRYFLANSVRFLFQDILCNYLFSPCNQLKIFLDI